MPVMIAPRSTPPPRAAVLAPTKQHARTAVSLDPQDVVEWLSALAHLVPADISKDLKRQVLAHRIDGNHFSALLNTCCLSELEVDNLSTLHQARMRKAWHADYPESASIRLSTLGKPDRSARRQSYEYLPESESRPRSFGPSRERESRPRSYEPQQISRPQNQNYRVDDAADMSHRQRRPSNAQTTYRDAHLVEEQRWTERAQDRQESWPIDSSRQNRPDMPRSQQPVDPCESSQGPQNSRSGTGEHEFQEASDHVAHSDQLGRPRSITEPVPSTVGVNGRTQRPIPSSLVVVIVDRLARKNGLDAASALADLQDVIPAALHRELAAVFGQGPFVAECQGNELSGGVPPALVVVVVDRLTRSVGVDQASAVSELQDVIPDFLYSELLAVFGQNSGAHQQVANRRPSTRSSSARRPMKGKNPESAREQTRDANDDLQGAHGEHDQQVPDSRSAPSEAAVREESSEMRPPKKQGSHASRERLRSKSPGKLKKVAFPDLDPEEASDRGNSPVEPDFQYKLPRWAAVAKAKFSSQELAQAAAFGQMLLVSYFARHAELKVTEDHAVTEREQNHGSAEPEPELLPDTRTRRSRPAKGGSPKENELLQNSCLVEVAPVSPGSGSRAVAKTKGLSKGKTSSVASARSTTRPGAELSKKSLTQVDHQARESKRSSSQDPSRDTRKNTDTGSRNDEAKLSPSQLAQWVRTLPPSHLPDKVREELATSLQLQGVDGTKFTAIAENPGELAKFGVVAPLHAMKVRKAWAQVLREDACRRVAAENFENDSDRKSVKLIV